MRNFCLSALVAFAFFGSLILGARSSYAQTAGGSLEAAFFRVLNAAGVSAWRVRADANGILTVESTATANTGLSGGPLGGVNGIKIDPASGAVQLPLYNSTQRGLLTPPSSGYLIMDTTPVASVGAVPGHPFGQVFISTGTGQGAWTIY